MVPSKISDNEVNEFRKMKMMLEHDTLHIRELNLVIIYNTHKGLTFQDYYDTNKGERV